ncbi:hypothetical protein LZ30DRAFT_734244 [Colletotrichum cereale]|nr:hypothetical protein LZ30DRAFT_734244 [Colletotrichum cereale]
MFLSFLWCSYGITVLIASDGAWRHCLFLHVQDWDIRETVSAPQQAPSYHPEHSCPDPSPDYSRTKQVRTLWRGRLRYR